jgi:hypothetical protein
MIKVLITADTPDEIGEALSRIARGGIAVTIEDRKPPPPLPKNVTALDNKRATR